LGARSSERGVTEERKRRERGRVNASEEGSKRRRYRCGMKWQMKTKKTVK
jgi:hypothetical protein